MIVFFVSSVPIAVRTITLTNRATVLSSCYSAYTEREAVFLLFADVPQRKKKEKWIVAAKINIQNI